MGKKLLLAGALAVAFAIPAGYVANEKFNNNTEPEPDTNKIVEHFQAADRSMDEEFGTVVEAYQTYQEKDQKRKQSIADKAGSEAIATARTERREAQTDLKAKMTAFIAKITVHAKSDEYQSYTSQLEKMDGIEKFSRVKFDSNWAPVIEKCAQESSDSHQAEYNKARVISSCARKSI